MNHLAIAEALLSRQPCQNCITDLLLDQVQITGHSHDTTAPRLLYHGRACPELVEGMQYGSSTMPTTPRKPTSCLGYGLCPYEFFNLTNKRWQVRSCEAHIRCGNTTTLDIRGNMFVVWVRTGKRWVVRMRLGVVPGESFCFVPQLVPIALDLYRASVKR